MADGLLPFALDRFAMKPALHQACPKCDGKGVDMRYCISAHAGQIRIDTIVDNPEHLDLTCQWCGYIRYMATKGAVTSNVNAPPWPERPTTIP